MTNNSVYLSGKTPISEASIIAENDLQKVLNLTLQAQQDTGLINNFFKSNCVPLGCTTLCRTNLY
jgi:hypothetical protein